MKFDRTAGYGSYDTKYLFKTNWKENTQYTISCDLFLEGSNAFANIGIAYTDGTTSDNRYNRTVDNWKKYFILSAENKTIKYLRVEYFAGVNYIDLDTFMVLEGAYTAETIPSYVPHQQQTFLFPLGNEKLMLGDYLAEDGIHHVRGQIVLKGSEDENWDIMQITATNVQRFYIKDIIIPKTSSTSLCSHFKYINSNSDIQHFRFGGTTFNEFIIYIDRTIETVEQLKVWLQSNPITVEYPLNEEVIVPYTSAQQEVWDYIEKEAHSYEGTTHITCPDETSLNFEVEAIRSPSVVDERLDNIESRLALIE